MGEHGRLGGRGAPCAREVLDRHPVGSRRTRRCAHAGIRAPPREQPHALMAAPGSRFREDRGEGPPAMATGAPVSCGSRRTVAFDDHRVRLAAPRVVSPRRHRPLHALDVPSVLFVPATLVWEREVGGGASPLGRRARTQRRTTDPAGGRSRRVAPRPLSSRSPAWAFPRSGPSSRRRASTSASSRTSVILSAPPSPGPRRPVRRRVGRELPPLPRDRAGHRSNGRHRRRDVAARGRRSGATAHRRPGPVPKGDRGVHRHGPSRRASASPRRDGRGPRRGRTRRAVPLLAAQARRIPRSRTPGRRAPARAACRTPLPTESTPSW